MDSVRQQKYAKLIQKELGDIFQREGRNWYGNLFITITNVRVTSDLGLARVQLSMFKADANQVLKSLNTNKNQIRKFLTQSIGKQARIIPELEFYHDDSLDYVEKMENIFKTIVIPPQEEDKVNKKDYKK